MLETTGPTTNSQPKRKPSTSTTTNDDLASIISAENEKHEHDMFTQIDHLMLQVKDLTARVLELDTQIKANEATERTLLVQEMALDTISLATKQCTHDLRDASTQVNEFVDRITDPISINHQMMFRNLYYTTEEAIKSLSLDTEITQTGTTIPSQVKSLVDQVHLFQVHDLLFDSPVPDIPTSNPEVDASPILNQGYSDIEAQLTSVMEFLQLLNDDLQQEMETRDGLVQKVNAWIDSPVLDGKPLSPSECKSQLKSAVKHGDIAGQAYLDSNPYDQYFAKVGLTINPVVVDDELSEVETQTCTLIKQVSNLLGMSQALVKALDTQQVSDIYEDLVDCLSVPIRSVDVLLGDMSKCITDINLACRDVAPANVLCKIEERGFPDAVCTSEIRSWLDRRTSLVELDCDRSKFEQLVGMMTDSGINTPEGSNGNDIVEGMTKCWTQVTEYVRQECLNMELNCDRVSACVASAPDLDLCERERVEFMNGVGWSHVLGQKYLDQQYIL